MIATIASLQAFDQIYVMTRGGPFFKTETLVVPALPQGLPDFEFGYASAIAWVLSLIVLSCQHRRSTSTSADGR